MKKTEEDVFFPLKTYPVVHASLNILIESAVMIKASAKARCPICGLGSEKWKKKKRKHQTFDMDTLGIYLKSFTFSIPNVDFRVRPQFSSYHLFDLKKD